jgi:tetratricopeptide (TPR) repeat protein
LVREELSRQKIDLNGDDPRIAVSGILLGKLLHGQGKLSEAAALFRKGAERAAPNTLNELAWSMATSANARERNSALAMELAEKAVAATGRTNTMMLDTLAAAFAESGQFDKAVSVQEEAIALLQSENEKRDYGSRLKLYESKTPYRDHAALATMITGLLAQGKFAEAEPLARECLALREKSVPDDWRTFNSRSMLGGALLGQKKYGPETEQILLSGYEGLKVREGKIPADARRLRLKEALERLVQLYEATNRPDQAAAWKQRLAELDSGEK